MKIRITEDVPRSLFFNKFNYNVGDVLTVNKKLSQEMNTMYIVGDPPNVDAIPVECAIVLLED